MDGNREKIKKKMKTFKESIIDIPRKTYAKAVFDDADTNNPKIKPSVKALIDKQIEMFEKEYPVVKVGLIGSILTKRYRADADLDLNVLFDVPKEKREEERTRLSKKYLSATSPDSIQGKNIPGTKHPINYYFITDMKTYNDQEKKADAVFDIEDNKFIKRPEDFTFDKSMYLKDFERKVQEIDVVKGELKRDIIDYRELEELSPDDILNLQELINEKLEEIEDSIRDIIKIGDGVDADRRAAFDKDMSPDEIRKYGIKNRLPKNVVYKMLEKYHYLKFYKKCKKILDDGKVSDKEIDDLEMHEARGKSVAFAFGRFNPPTIGHEKLINKVKSLPTNDYKIF
jgi:predicted nucleotidyltransferase